MFTIIFPIIIIIFLVVLVCWLIKAFLESERDTIPVIGILISVVGIVGGDSVYDFLQEIPIPFSILGRQTITFPDDCDLDNILKYDGHTYAICKTKTIDDFWDAQNLCVENKGHLAVINNQAENIKLYDYFIKGLNNKSAYFGYTDANNEGTWYWVDGSPTKEEGGYENWCEIPNDLNGVEDYALFWYKDPAYTWNDADFGKDSDGKVYFIIEWDFEEK